MLTGWRAEQTGVTGNDTPLRVKRPDIVTMPQLCKDAGWQSHGSLRPGRENRRHALVHRLRLHESHTIVSWR